MVYCGKPSKGCSSCRERKIRCDQREPRCGQCEKRQQECPGYRNLVDLMFRDESSHVIKKAKAKARKKALLSAERNSSSPDTEPRKLVTPEPRVNPLSLVTRSSRAEDPATGPSLTWVDDENSLLPSPDSGSWPTTPMVALLYNLNPTYQERGTAFFFSRYVTVDENGTHQRFDFVYDVWKPASLAAEGQVDGVLASMTAVGLAGLGYMTRSAEVLEAARKSYGTALRLTNLALKDPVEAVKDTTMLSVLILSLFEMMTDATPRTMKAWQEHVNGAIALAGMRGAEQFKNPGGKKMFLLLWYKVMISCVQRQMPMPQTLMNLGKELSKDCGWSDPTWEIATPICKVLQTRYDIKSGKLSESQAILDQLFNIEDEFESLLARFPAAWQYRTLKLSKHHPAIFRSTCHAYPSLWQATTWNGIRSSRMVILESMLNELQKMASRHSRTAMTEQYAGPIQRARHKLKRICEDILYSVPQHVGLLNQNGSGYENLDPTTTPIPNVTVRQSPSPPTSPPTVSSSCSEGRTPGERKTVATGPTLLNPTLSENSEEEATKFMLLASAQNSIVWPLYMVGMASVCTEDMKAYVVERLRALYTETGQRQAEVIANMVEAREIASPERRESTSSQLPLRGGPT